MTDVNEIISGHPLLKIIELSFVRKKHHVQHKRRLKPGGLRQAGQGIARARNAVLIFHGFRTVLGTDAAQSQCRIRMAGDCLRTF